MNDCFLEVKTPWGDALIGCPLDAIRHCSEQLEYILINSLSPNPEYTKQDLQGYWEVLSTNKYPIPLAGLAYHLTDQY